MNKIAHYAAAKAVKLHQSNLATRGARPGDGSWLSSKALYRLTMHRIRGLMSPYAAVHADKIMRRLRKLDSPMLSIIERNGFLYLGGTDHWCA